MFNTYDLKSVQRYNKMNFFNQNEKTNHYTLIISYKISITIVITGKTVMKIEKNRHLKNGKIRNFGRILRCRTEKLKKLNR